MARPKKTASVVEAPVATNGYTTEQGDNGKWLVRFNAKPVRVFVTDAEAKKYVDYMVSRGK